MTRARDLADLASSGVIEGTEVADDAITYAKIQNVSADERILGRVSGANGVVEELTKAQMLTMMNVADGSNAYTHPNHSGEVTSTADGATVIASNIVDEDNLKISNSPTNGYALTAQSGNTGGMTWAEMSAGTTLTGSTNNTIPTVTGANALTGEAKLTYDANVLAMIVPDDFASILRMSSNRVLAGEYLGSVEYQWNGTPVAKIMGLSGSDTTNKDDGHLSFYTTTSGGSITERMRITSEGAVGINTGSMDAKFDVIQAADDTMVCQIKSTGASFGSAALRVYATRNTTNESYELIQARNGGGAVMKCFDSGDIDNTNNAYGALSDERIKQDIEDASSQWEDIKALKVRKFKLKRAVNKDGVENTPYQLGVIAQEVEAAGMNRLVKESKPEKEDVSLNSDFGTIVLGTADNGAEAIKDDDGNITGYEDVFNAGQKVKAVKYSVLYMKAIKCLQEAMEKIETLEAKVTALENA
jgi:hypothetical protein